MNNSDTNILICEPINKIAAIVTSQTGCSNTVEMSRKETIERIKYLSTKRQIIKEKLRIKNYRQKKNFTYNSVRKKCLKGRFKNKQLVDKYILIGRQMQIFFRKLSEIKKHKKAQI